MKIAVISDIHGNLPALEAVLEDIKSQGCEKIFCCGDIAMAGAEPDKTIDVIKNLNCKIVQGNTDEMLANMETSKIEEVKSYNAPMLNGLISDFLLIGHERQKYLKNLPAQKRN